MKVFKKKGEFTRLQILAEIAKQEPHLRQKDIADTWNNHTSRLRKY
jgi:putative transcriptional regulator